MNWITMIVPGVFAAGFFYLLWRAGTAWRKARGTRLVTCPETQQSEAVELDKKRALRSALTGHVETHLSECTRWPERADCAQACRAQIEGAPQGCRVVKMLADWYTDKSCVLCGKKIGAVDWLDHRPGLLDPTQRPLGWHDLEVKRLPEILGSHRPLCWDCFVTESFIRDNPEKVTYRDVAQ